MMNDDASLILDYLPYSYKSPQEGEYIISLWETFLANYEKQKYQFAFIAYHMLFMSFVYFSIWKIKMNKEKDFAKALIGFSKDQENTMLNASSPFSFSKIKESSVFRFLKLVRCNNAKIGEFTKIVKVRNDITHSNGNIFFDRQDTVDEKINEVLKSVEEIQGHTKEIIDNVFMLFLMDSWDAEVRQFSDDADQIREILIHQNYLSKKDVGDCLVYDITPLEKNENISRIRKMFRVFKKEYAEI